jgi:hypothetical protein
MNDVTVVKQILIISHILSGIFHDHSLSVYKASLGCSKNVL